MKSSLSVVGLTGGIACGKSMVAKFFRDASIPVLDADEFAHMVLAVDGAAYQPVLDAFGVDILGTDRKTIDRQKLGKQVFDSPKKRQLLESITHPAIANLTRQGMMLIEEKGEKLAVYEAALLVETGIYKSMDGLVVVSCSLENQLRRVCARDGLSKEAAATRIASQLPLTDKVAVADYVVENDGTVDELREAAIHLANQLKERFG